MKKIIIKSYFEIRFETVLEIFSVKGGNINFENIFHK